MQILPVMPLSLWRQFRCGQERKRIAGDTQKTHCPSGRDQMALDIGTVDVLMSCSVRVLEVPYSSGHLRGESCEGKVIIVIAMVWTAAEAPELLRVPRCRRHGSRDRSEA
ncbi:hypothetical protein ACOMHN_064176 [Nucella lapillus]